MIQIPFSYLRGGTSRAVFFRREHLPEDRSRWHEIFRQAIGLNLSPDAAAMGTHLPTRKIGVIAPSSRPDADVEYQHFQMNDNTGLGDARGSCGNMTSAVGPYAVNTGLFPAREGLNTIRIYSLNTGRIIHSTFEVHNGRAAVHGDTRIHGVPGTGSPIRLDFLNPGGGYSGRLFPTGSPSERLELPGFDPIDATIIDCANPVVIVRSRDLGLTGTENTDRQIPPEILSRIRMVRCAAAVRLGMVETPEQADISCTYVPHVALTAPAQDYTAHNGQTIHAEEMDVCCRAVFSKLHHAYPMAASIATAAAIQLPGTVAHEFLKPAASSDIILGHPSGTMKVETEIRGGEVLRGTVIRTAQHLFDGTLYLE